MTEDTGISSLSGFTWERNKHKEVGLMEKQVTFFPPFSREPGPTLECVALCYSEMIKVAAYTLSFQPY